jgi:cobalamin biosynthesis protein CobW
MPDKQRLLQIQAVGPRLNCWYEGQPTQLTHASEPTTSDLGELQLVLLGFQLDPSRMEQQLSIPADSAGTVPRS